MKGLALSEAYYEVFGNRILDEADRLDPGLSGRLSIGLTGEGSQCFGWDDEISRDHDFAPGFCVFLSDEDDESFGPSLQAVYDSLPASFLGFSRQNIIDDGRLGIISCSRFYGRLTGSLTSDTDWLFVPESSLAAASSGLIWHQGCTQFDTMRRRILDFFPEDVLRKKIAARAAVLSQSGQYNLMRVIRRHDRIAALFAMSRFAEAAISMIHLLGRRYTPFYKWAFHSLQEMMEDRTCSAASLAAECLPLLERLLEIQVLLSREKFTDAESLSFDLTERICARIAAELRQQGFSTVESDFLQDHLGDIMSGIRDPRIRSMHPMADPAV